MAKKTKDPLTKQPIGTLETKGYKGFAPTELIKVLIQKQFRGNSTIAGPIQKQSQRDETFVENESTTNPSSVGAAQKENHG